MQNNNETVRATATIRGGNGYPDLYGIAIFEQLENGVLVTVKAYNLPKNSVCDGGVFALHIHKGESCMGNGEDEFSNAETHYNPSLCPHPFHAGDLPPLIGNNGFAYMSVLTDRFTLSEIINKVIVIHDNKDDFTSQPAGNSGVKIGCGKIIRSL